MKKDASRFSPKDVLFHRTFFTAPSHELYSVVKDQDYQVLVIDAEIDTFGVTI